MNMNQMWRHIAKLRKEEGDLDGARRALQNANVYAGWRYASSSGHGMVWSKTARAKLMLEIAQSDYADVLTQLS